MGGSVFGRAAATAGVAALALVTQVGVQSVTARPAAALPGVTTFFGWSDGDSTAVKDATANCPPGKRVLGGGARIEGVGGGGSDIPGRVILTRMQPIHTATGDSYAATGTEQAAGYSGSWRVVVEALCGDAPPGLQIRTATFDEPTSAQKGVSVNCPSSPVWTRPVGVGAAVTNTGGGVSLQGLTISGVAVTVHAYDDLRDRFLPPSNWAVTVYAVCAQLPEETRVTDATDNNSFRVKELDVRCPLGMTALAYQFWKFDSNGNVRIYQTYPWADRSAVHMRAAAPQEILSDWKISVTALCF